MELFPSLILISLIGGIVAIDTTASFQLMISQPVVVCPVIGLIFGHPEIGIEMGILLELPWLVNLPCGGQHGSDGNLGAVVAAGLAIYFASLQINTENIIIIISIIYGLAVARFGTYSIEFVRRANVSLVHNADKAAADSDMKKISMLNLTGVLYSFFMGFAVVGISFLLGTLIIKPLILFVHRNFDFAFGLAKFAILGIGFGGVLTLFVTKETKWYFILPMIISGIVWIVFII